MLFSVLMSGAEFGYSPGDCYTAPLNCYTFCYTLLRLYEVLKAPRLTFFYGLCIGKFYIGCRLFVAFVQEDNT